MDQPSFRSRLAPPPVAERGFQVRRFILRTGALVVIVMLLGYLLLRVEPQHATAMEALDRDQLLVGAWLGDWPGGDNDLLTSFERETDARLDLVDLFMDWYTPIQNVSATIQYLHAQGKIPIITWEPHGFTTVDITQGKTITTLRDGRHLPLRTYLDEFATGACTAIRDSDIPVFMRPIHEMNGGWFTWGTGYTDAQGHRPNTNETYRAAWKTIYTTFENRCGDKIKWIWAVNHYSTDGTSWMDTYPGAAYVDYVGLDGYNWGKHASWGWQSFHTVFHSGYCALAKGTDKPIIIAELGSTEAGGDKAAWIHDAFDQMTSGKYPRVRGVVWFNDPKYEIEIKGPMDWPIESSPKSVAAFKDAVSEVQLEQAKMPPIDAVTNVCA